MSHYKTYESGRREVTFDIKLVLFSRSAVNSKFFCNFDKLFSLAEFASQIRLNIIAREICCAIASIIDQEQPARVLIVGHSLLHYTLLLGSLNLERNCPSYNFFLPNLFPPPSWKLHSIHKPHNNLTSARYPHL